MDPHEALTVGGESDSGGPDDSGGLGGKGHAAGNVVGSSSKTGAGVAVELVA